jgi:hypothetical protein
VVIRHLHIKRGTTVAQILSSEHSALLTNKQRSRVRIAADVVGADGQVSDLEALDTVHVEALVQDTVLDDAVAVPGRHRARAERVPGGLDVA